jgi:hypothetical protein
MRLARLVAVGLASALIIAFTPTAASSWDVPAPDWASATGMPADFVWGTWTPCDPNYREDHCVVGAVWTKEDGTKVQGKWVPNPDFKFAEWNQVWNKSSDGKDLQNFNRGIRSIGAYSFAGLTTPCGDDRLYPDVRATTSAMQAHLIFTCATLAKAKLFDERFSVTIKSTHLLGRVGAVSSNGRKPEIAFSVEDSTYTLTTNFAYFPADITSTPGVSLDVCRQNQERAIDGGWAWMTSMFWLHRWNDPYLAKNPGDLIAATNGWNCGGLLLWDESESALVMQVGAPHYDVDGSVIEGWYEGQIRGRYLIARYGVTPALAAGRARLEVTYQNGEVKVATLTASYDSATDWIIFRGYGFTYSAPKLILRFEKDATPVVEPTPPPATPVALPKAKTIVIKCVKGKVVKKVSGVKPKCPAGFKKR